MTYQLHPVACSNRFSIDNDRNVDAWVHPEAAFKLSGVCGPCSTGMLQLDIQSLARSLCA